MWDTWEIHFCQRGRQRHFYRGGPFTKPACPCANTNIAPENFRPPKGKVELEGELGDIFYCIYPPQSRWFPTIYLTKATPADLILWVKNQQFGAVGDCTKVFFLRVPNFNLKYNTLKVFREKYLSWASCRVCSGLHGSVLCCTQIVGEPENELF